MSITPRLLVLALLTSTGCSLSDDVPAQPSSAAVVDETVASCPTPRIIPTRAPTAPTTDLPGSTRWLAAQRILLGVSDFGSTDYASRAWQCFGFDLDDRTTSPDASFAATDAQDALTNDTCARSANAPIGVLSDGADGVDNNFGAQLVPVFRTLNSTIQGDFDTAIARGGATLLLRIDDVGGDDDAHAPGALYVTLDRSSATDAFVVDQSSLTGPDVTQPVVYFPNGYVKNAIWWSGEAEGAVTTTLSFPFSFSFSIGNQPAPSPAPQVPIHMPIQRPRFAVSLGTNQAIEGGVVAGDFGWLTPALSGSGVCPNSSTATLIDATFSQSDDLTAAASDLNQAGAPCDSISFGVGLQLTPVIAPTTFGARPADPTTAAEAACDAGTSTGSAAL